MTRAAELREMAALLEEWGMEKGSARAAALYLICGYGNDGVMGVPSSYEGGAETLARFLQSRFE